MGFDQELQELTEFLENCSLELNKKSEQEAYINGQMAVLRMELAKLRDSRYEVKQKQRKAQIDKDSVTRKLELEREAALIQENIEKKMAEAEALIANAPWKDDAFDWQIKGAIQLPDRALLGDKRGLGKTFSSIIWMRVKKANKVLVCLRKEVASDFIKELGIREPGLFVYPLLGANANQRKIAAMLLNHHKKFVVVTNIESWRKDITGTTEDILAIDYDAVILDEAHHISNSKTSTAQGFFKIAERIPKVLEMTGTPIKNRPQEMYSLLHALYPLLFETEAKFRRDFCIQAGQNRWIFTAEGLKTLVKQISSFYVARTPEDIGRQIPPPRMIEYKLSFDNHLKQKQAYLDMTELSMAILDSGKVIPIVSQLAIMTRQAQVVSWPAGINFRDPETDAIIRFDVHESVKADWAEDLLVELVEEGERIVLFSRFKPAIYELRRRLELRNLPVAVITGDEKGKTNTEDIFNDFDLKTAPANPRWPILLATYDTVGESANLNAARHAILYDRKWNPGNDDQAIGRIDRINSVDQATVHLPTVELSIDEYMVQLIEDKRNIVSDFKTASSMQASLLEHLRKSIE